MKKEFRSLGALATATVLAVVLPGPPARADQCINDDLIVDGSTCIGLDCVCNSEVFSFDTLRLKENNLRITFIDTSSTASFPRGDWQIRANDSVNGGANKLTIDWLGTSVSNGSLPETIPFTIEGTAPSNSIYVDDGGRVGFKTSVPQVELHSRDGDTPTLRLQQDGSGGFTPQTWDVAGNDANFFIRDVTNGSTLPFRIRPGAPSNAIFIDVTDGDVGMGTSSVDEELHIESSAADDVIVQLESTAGAAQNTGFRYINSAATWSIFNNSLGNLQFNVSGVGQLVTINGATGDLTLVAGNCSDVPGGGGCTPDYVFEPGYELMSLGALAEFVAENRHLPNVPSAEENARHGIGVRRLNFAMLEKIEELVLYTLEQQEEIERLAARDRERQAALAALTARLETLERLE